MPIADTAREQRALIALSMIPHVGPGRTRALVAHFGSAGAVLEASAYALAQVQGVGGQTARAIARFEGFDAVDHQLRRAAQVQAVLLPAWADAYPERLRHLYDPPVALWVRGTLDAADRQAVAIVGTRRATAYGKQVAYAFARDLAAHGITVVSGLAYGIDAAAHEGALDAGGRTLAVLGSGVDRIYPSAHQRLARRILQQGALLSEYALGAAPDAPNFPRRNRIISGMTLGTLVAEAFPEGGALITARLALEQNREVFAVPHALDRPTGAGGNRLIRDGHARLVTCVEEILEELQLAPQAAPPPVAPADLHPAEAQLWAALGPVPRAIDTLCAETGLDVSDALVYLLSLEFKGLIRQLAGKQFLRA